VLQQTPLAVTSELPSSVILPPETAVVIDTELTTEVVRVAVSIGFDLNEISFP